MKEHKCRSRSSLRIHLCMLTHIQKVHVHAQTVSGEIKRLFCWAVVAVVCMCKHAWLTAPHIKTKALLGNCRWLTRHRCLTLRFSPPPPFQSPSAHPSLWKCVTLWLNLLLSSAHLFEDQRALSGPNGLRQLRDASLVEVGSWETAVVDKNLGAAVSAVGWAWERGPQTGTLANIETYMMLVNFS